MYATDITASVETPGSLQGNNFLHLDRCSSPQHLRSVAQIYGMETPSLENARVLTLGCKTGFNLIPFCSAWENACVIGIDIDADAIIYGKNLVEQSGIKNLQLYCLQLDELLSINLGEQDYIILQGCFSLLDNATRDVVLSWSMRHLSNSGIVAIQWPCYPGAKSHELLRDAMLLHSSLVKEENEKISSARAVATWLSLGMADNNPHKSEVKSLINALEEQSDSELALRYLSGLNEASWLVEFNERIEKHGFIYLGDAEAWGEVPSYYGDSIAQMLKVINPMTNKILHQQYLDFAVNREQRFSLLVAEKHRDRILPLPDKRQLVKLNWAGNFQRLFSQAGKVDNAAYTPEGYLLRTDNELTLRILDVLGEAWPLSLSFNQIVWHTRLPEVNEPNHANNVLDILWKLWLKGTNAFSYTVGPCSYSKNNCKILTPISGLKGVNYLGENLKLGFNLWHQQIDISDEEFLVIETGLIEPDLNNISVIDSLRRKGMLTGSLRAWQKYIQNVINLKDASDCLAFINGLMIFTHYRCEEQFVINNVTLLNSRVRSRHPSVSSFPGVDTRLTKKINQLLDQDNYKDAIEFVADLVKNMNGNPHALQVESHVYIRLNRFDKALSNLVKALSIECTPWSFYYDYSSQLWRLGYTWYAEKVVRYCLRFNTRDPMLWVLLCSLYQEQKNFVLAEHCARRALAIDPVYTTALSSLASTLTAQSRLTEAVQWLRKACESAPNEFVYFTNYLFGLIHSPDVDSEYLYAEHARYGRMVERWAKRQGISFELKNSREMERKLRIGFVSGDFGNHPVTNFIRPIWESLDKERFEIYAYKTSSLNDVITQQLKLNAQEWIECVDLSFVELAEKIYSDKIDILIDLSGHTDYNRLPTFALRPAPVTMSFIGYPGTTGLKEMDYMIVHNKLAQPGVLDEQFSEALVYMPFGKQFEPVADAPEIKSQPVSRNECFTFGSFNRPSKINDEVLRCWASIMQSCPDSRLIIGFIDSDILVSEIVTKFQSWGVPKDRLIFRAKLPMIEYLELHNEIDILLDTFPYTGGTTTNHALWMGVPTLTLTGDRLASCQGRAGMLQYGLEGFVVQNIENYVARAIYYYNHNNELIDLRKSLRSIIISNGKRVRNPSKYLEDVLMVVWKKYCLGNPVTSFSIEE